MILREVKEFIESWHLPLKDNSVILRLYACRRNLTMIDSVFLKLLNNQFFCFFKSHYFIWILQILPQAAFIEAFDNIITFEVS